LGADAILTLVVTIVFGGIIVVANYADQTQRPGYRQLVIGLLAVINVLFIVLGLLQVVSAYSTIDDSSKPDKPEAWGALATTLFFSALATAILVPRVRRALTTVFPRFRPRKHEGDAPPVVVSEQNLPQESPAQAEAVPLFPQMLNYYTTTSVPPVLSSTVRPDDWAALPDESPKTIAVRGFNPQSMVHTVALALAVYYLGSQIMGFILGGGLSGVAESFEGGITAWDLLLNAFPQIVLPLLGVGFILRRNVPETFKRLGIVRPTPTGMGVAVAATIGLFIFVTIAGVAWQMLVSEETYDEQTEASNALSESIDTIGMVFLLAILAAVGEEIAFRGALQPVFGLWPTAIFFMLVHLQYTLTPASLIILGVSVTFGWIRQNYGLTVAMLTHFLYDFIPLALTLSFSEEALNWLHKLL
jgi:membrane protease YdiL (CAAX protease family)